MEQTSTLQTIYDIVRPFLNEEVSLDPETELFEDGLIDSLNVLQIIARLETTFSISISPLDMTFDDFRTCATIAECINKKFA